MNEDDLLIDEWIEHLILEKNVSKETLESYSLDIKQFNLFIQNYNETLKSVNYDTIILFFKNLSSYGMKERTIARKLSSIKGFYKHLVSNDHIDKNPIRFLETPRIDNGDREPFTFEEVELFFSFIKKDTLPGFRDYLIFDLMYSCGLRISEVIDLKLSDIFYDDYYILVNGKGSKQRIIPVTERMIFNINEYINNYRVMITNSENSSNLITNLRGKKISRMGIWKVMRNYLIKANLSSKFHPHSFRHSFASHMIEGGADLRSVQVLLGHEDISTTQIYTNVTPTHLIEVHRMYHPRGH
ncbi:MAG: tyrosine-type recombinase/integrase [Candidatus Delongbacteria bacterium]|nr:tyrosine-type recombinase/integrase [Candidatus Delongbacteria bacterium]